MKKEFETLLTELASSGLIFDKKTVRKFTISSGAIFLPPRFIGKSFRLILIPIEEEKKEVVEVKKEV